MTTFDQIMYEFLYRISKPRWDDGIIPAQVSQLATRDGKTGKVIELGCGTGTLSIYLAQQGLDVIGVDISSTAIRQAREKASRAELKPEFILRDATHLDMLRGPFDIALDVGCFHAMSGAATQNRYALELTRLTEPGSTFLMWGMDHRPRSLGLLSPDKVEKTFAPGFILERVEPSQFHGRLSKWYWMKRQ